MHLILFNWLHCCCSTLQSPKHLDTSLLRGSIPAVQESNLSPALALTLSFYLWQTGRYFLWAQTSSLLEADTTLSLKVRIEVITDGLSVSFGSFGVGCQGPTCPLGCLGTLSLVHHLGNVPGFLSHSNPSLLPAVLAFQSLAWLYFHFW